jgi:superfamily II DNA or RNA helicase
MAIEIQPIGDDYFRVRFPYDAALVARIRGLRNRRWNKSDKCWEIHVSQLGRVLRMFGLEQRSVDPKLLRAFHIYRIRNYRVRIEAGNVMARLMGSDLPIKKIDEVTSFHVPGYQFMPRFMDGSWDGRRHLFDRRRMTFPTGLLKRVTAVLDEAKVAYQITHPEPEGEAQEALPEPLALKTPAYKLRDYQQEALDAALTGERGVLELATGSGKTAVAACLIHQLAQPALFLVHTRDLLHQTHDFLAEHLGTTIGRVGDGVIDLQPVTVATVQTCARALGVKAVKDTDDEAAEPDPTDIRGAQEALAAHIRKVPVVFFDECHHLPADMFYGVAMETHGARYRFGLSATPYRTDHQDLLLEAALGPKLYRANASALIDKGYLVPPVIRFLAAPVVKFTGKTPDYKAVVDECVVENDARNRLIAAEARKLAKKGRSVLILVSQVRHGETLREHLPEAPLVQGSDPATARQKVFRALQRKTTPIVIATTLADEGLDIPTLDAVILASGGKSETRALQRIGRALRTAPKKHGALIIDFFDNAPFLREHALRRLEIFESEPRFKVETVGFKP